MFTFTAELFRSLLKKSATVSYPKKPVKPAERARGHIEIEIGQCIFCGMCQRKCPTDAITVTKTGRKWGINRFRCILCNSCVEVCPKKCLDMDNKYSEASDTQTIFEAVGEPVPAAIPEHESTAERKSTSERKSTAEPTAIQPEPSAEASGNA